MALLETFTKYYYERCSNFNELAIQGLVDLSMSSNDHLLAFEIFHKIRVMELNIAMTNLELLEEKSHPENIDYKTSIRLKANRQAAEFLHLLNERDSKIEYDLQFELAYREIEHSFQDFMSKLTFESISKSINSKILLIYGIRQKVQGLNLAS